MQRQGEVISGSEAAVRTGACIVGGGPAGLLLGLLLAKRGANVIVLEAHRTFYREFRGEILQPSTARLLDQIGLLSYILERPHLLLKEGRLLVDGRQRAGFSFDKIAPQYPYAIWMPQPIFLDALARKAALYPGFQLWMGANVTELVEENGTVVGVRGLRDGKEPFTVGADVVVGADGRHSMIRKLGKFAIEYEHHDFDMIWFVVDPPDDWSRTLYLAAGTAPLLLLPKYPNQIQVGIPTCGRMARLDSAGDRGSAESSLRSARYSKDSPQGCTISSRHAPLEIDTYSGWRGSQLCSQSMWNAH